MKTPITIAAQKSPGHDEANGDNNRKLQAHLQPLWNFLPALSILTLEIRLDILRANV
ncbi:hypothetical protein HUU40_08120 [candidate division KSB1 bacterium]|nr:hypothetical protein [candidate division KSB1 bacterium]